MSMPAQANSKAGKVLYVSRSAPPGVSGSAHVLKALLAADDGRQLLAAGACSFWSSASVEDGRLYRFPTELSLFGRGARFLAPFRQLLLGRLTRRITALAADPAIVRIVGVFPDALYCEAALDAAQRTDKPIAIYFHNTYADNRSGVAGRHAQALEARMIGESERLYFISEALMERFVAKYPGIEARSEVVRHPVSAAGSGAQSRGFVSMPVRATLMGNLNHSNLDAATRLLRALAGRADIRIRLCTPVPKLLLQARGVSLDGIEYLGYLPEEKMPALLAETDLFLLPHGLTGGYSDQEYLTIFPTRAAHYLAQSRCILAHCPDDSGLARFLRRHDCAICVGEPDDAALVQAFERLLGDAALQQALAERARRAATLFDPAAILGQLIQAQEMPA